MRRLLALLAAGLLAVALAAPASVAAAGSTYQVPAPHGGNDTAAIQKGLDWCVAHGPGCTVQLQAGTYKSDLLLANNFRGTFKGAGMHQTTIRALPNLLVNETDPWVLGECVNNLTDCRYPWFITFVNGSVRVSDLALDFPATNGTETTPWTIGGDQVVGLAGALVFAGFGHSTASVDRVSVTGRADHSSNVLWGLGFNVANGIVFDGWFPAGPTYPSSSWLPRSGTFSVRDSSVQTVSDAITNGGGFTNSQFTITGNRIDNADIGIDFGAANSTFDIAYNDIAADNAAPEEINHAGILVEPSGFADLVNGLSRFAIHNNTIRVSDGCGCLMIGMWLQDANAYWGAPDHWFTASITHNTVSLPSTFTLPDNGKEGIDANNITGTVIRDNTFTGATAGTWDAISLWGNDPSLLPSKGNLITGNSVSGLKPGGSQPFPVEVPGLGLSQIYLDAYTTGNTVVCARHSDTLFNWGTGNTVVGCTAPTLPAAAAPKTAATVRHASMPAELKMRRLHP